MFITDKPHRIVALVQLDRRELAELLEYTLTVVKVGGRRMLVRGLAVEVNVAMQHGPGICTVRVWLAPCRNRFAWGVPGKGVVRAQPYNERDVTRMREILGKP